MSVTERTTDPANQHIHSFEGDDPDRRCDDCGIRWSDTPAGEKARRDAATAARRPATDGLRVLADWLDEHPEVPLPAECQPYSSMNIFPGLAGDERPPSEVLATVARAMGKAEKFSNSSFFGVRRSFGPVRLDCAAYHEEVCTRVVVGHEEVEEPDPAAVAALPKVKRQREVIEWKCPPSLLSPAEVAAGRAGVAEAKAQLAPVENEPV